MRQKFSEFVDMNYKINFRKTKAAAKLKTKYCKEIANALTTSLRVSVMSFFFLFICFRFDMICTTELETCVPHI